MSSVFFSYSHEDEQFRDQLEKHLSSLKHEGLIDTWHDRRIVAGDDFASEIDRHIDSADVILLLVSAAFLASHYCYGVEMQRALQRYQAGSARVIPVIVRPVDWHRTPLGELLAAPTDGKAITTWANADEAYTDIAKHVRAALPVRAPRQSDSSSGFAGIPPVQGVPSAAPSMTSSLPRSSNMRLKKNFTDADRDRFLHDSFEFFAQFFEGSLQELQLRNEGVEARFRRVDGNHFTCQIFQNGKRAAQCGIRLGGGFRDAGITYSSNIESHNNSFNEMLSVRNDDHSIFLEMLGMSFLGAKPDPRLSTEAAAEHLWALLIGQLQ